MQRKSTFNKVNFKEAGDKPGRSTLFILQQFYLKLRSIVYICYIASSKTERKTMGMKFHQILYQRNCLENQFLT